MLPARLVSTAVIAALTASLMGCGDGPGGGGPPMTVANPARKAQEAQRAVGYRLYWAGPSIAGLPLTEVSHEPGLTTFIYGTCTPQPAGDESSCSPPLQIQVASICDRNALLLDVRPHARFTTRRAVVFDYGDGRLELAAGASQMVVWAAPKLARQAMAALRPVGKPRQDSRLPDARYPLYYTAQLRRVHDAFARTRSVRAVRSELQISESAVKFELELAHELGAERLRRANTRSAPALNDVKQDRLAATLADEEGAAAAARLHLTPARLQAGMRRARARRNGCPLESLR